jgi:hypothetical protein
MERGSVTPSTAFSHAFLKVAGLPSRHAADATRWWRQQRLHPSARDY